MSFLDGKRVNLRLKSDILDRDLHQTHAGLMYEQDSSRLFTS